MTIKKTTRDNTVTLLDMNDNGENAEISEREEESIKNLIKAAGPSFDISEARKNRVNSVVHDAWQKSLKEKAEQKRQKNKMVTWSAMWASAACLLLAVLAMPYFSLDRLDSAQSVAVVSVAKGVGYFFSGNGKNAISKDTVIHAGEIIETDKDGGVALALSNNGSLRLNQQTRLTVISESAFELEHGSVYFDSGIRGEKKPIEIRTKLGVLTDIGTQFEVRFVHDNLRVRVREGKVQLDAVEKKNDNLLSVKQELVLTENGETSLTTIEPDSLEWSWVQSLAPIMDLAGHNLDEYLNWLTRENGWELHYQSQALQHYAETNILQGSINGMTPRETLTAVAAISDIAFNIDSGVLLIKKMD